MKQLLLYTTAAAMIMTSFGAIAAPEGTGTIRATLEVIKPYDIQTTPLAFGEHTLPTSGSSTITINPNDAGASKITIEGSDGEATVALNNNGNFTLSGNASGSKLNASAFFDGDKSSTKVNLVEGKAETSVGAEVKLDQTTAADSYTGNVTLNVTKNV